MPNAIRNFSKFRYLLYELIKKDIKLKYRSSVLGVLWTLLEPLLTMIVLTVVFSGLLGKGDDNFPVYILCGRLLYSFFSAGTKTALKSIRKNSSTIKKVYVPKYMYPLASTLSSYIIFLISLIVLVGVALYEQVKITGAIFGAIFPLIMIFFLTLGVGLILAVLDVFFRDLEYLWTVILMLIMYTCAIFYKVESLKSVTNEWIFKINPLYSLIVNFRNSIFGRPLDMYHFWYALGFSAAVMLFGCVLFFKKQDRFILYI
ncbi:MAG: ABC transporter permease [Lachnospiraceae bacterium]|nr:ABC transporter permease [Lachnospiraceae bacterium]MBO4762826.1 ABC transporter permease [Lachnospiraceae bacterium]MBQ6090942.1 ABC transporter permease [Lachnospiraceae bacterium]